MKNIKHAQFQKTWVEIDSHAVTHNISVLRSFLRPATKFYAVVKSNAYGHDLIKFSKLADRENIDGFCVDSVEEGVQLRAHSIRKPILVLGATFPELWSTARRYNLMITISHKEMFRKFIRAHKGLSFHLKVDTGMRRQGFYPEEIHEVLQEMKKNSFFSKIFEGVYTRFAAESDLRTAPFTLQQIAVFQSVREEFIRNGFSRIMFHAAGTGGIALYPEAHFDMVRPGIGLYGYWPSQEIHISRNSRKGCAKKLLPVLSWYTRISEIKKIFRGDKVGYDGMFTAIHPMTAAILPLGYWHGFPRSLSKEGRVLVRGEYAHVIGYISMDMVTIALPVSSQIKIGDRVVLIGKEKGKFLYAHEVASRADMIHYELLTTINPYIARNVK